MELITFCQLEGPEGLFSFHNSKSSPFEQNIVISLHDIFVTKVRALHSFVSALGRICLTTETAYVKAATLTVIVNSNL